MAPSDGPVSWAEALDALGLQPCCTEQEVRSSYRRLLRQTHPDLSAATDATDRTVRLTAAYETVLDHLRAVRADVGSGDGRSPGPLSPSRNVPETPRVGVVLVDGETIAIDAPALEVVPLLIEAAHQLGEISYLDPVAGLLEVIVEFVGGPTSSVVLTMQGRSNATTEVFCGVEALSGGEVPGADAVAQLLVRTLRGEDPTA